MRSRPVYFLAPQAPNLRTHGRRRSPAAPKAPKAPLKGCGGADSAAGAIAAAFVPSPDPRAAKPGPFRRVRPAPPSGHVHGIAAQSRPATAAQHDYAGDAGDRGARRERGSEQPATRSAELAARFGVSSKVRGERAWLGFIPGDGQSKRTEERARYHKDSALHSRAAIGFFKGSESWGGEAALDPTRGNRFRVGREL